MFPSTIKFVPRNETNTNYLTQLVHAKHQYANFSICIKLQISENAQEQLFLGPKIKIMDFERENGIFCEFQLDGAENI